MSFRRIAKATVNTALKPLGYVAVHLDDTVDYRLHEYSSYEEYRAGQIATNKRKIDKVWADETILSLVAEDIKAELPRREIWGICHGARNGFEQNFFNKTFGFNVIGTDISDTATRFENSVVWDFHDENPDWIGKYDFVYSNSLDQGWRPKQALTSWLGQLKPDGVLYLEHGEMHGPRFAGEMDPFGVKPNVMPFVLADWFGHGISTKVLQGTKDNNGQSVFVFAIKRVG